MHHEEIKFPENTPTFHDANPTLDPGHLEIRQSLIRRLGTVAGHRRGLTELQETCDHPVSQPFRGKHQCLVCGLIRYASF